MELDQTERFIKDAARLGWSRNEVCNVLEISWSSLSDILDVIGPVTWGPSSLSPSRKRSAELQRGVFTPALQAAQVLAIAKRRELAEHEVLGQRGTIKQLAAKFGVSATTVRRRVAEEGLSLEQALTTPATPRHLRRKRAQLRSVAAERAHP